MQVRVIEREGYRIRVTSRGHGLGPHVIVLPGLAADWHALAPQVRELGRLGYTTHVVDLPGFALKPHLQVKDATFPHLAGYVAAAAEEIGVRRALFVGHSLGGGVALHLALRRPDLVDGLVLIAPAALGNSLHWVYKLYCLPLFGRALLRPEKLGASYVRRFMIGRNRRGDPHFVKVLIRHSANHRARAQSTRAIVWANQPGLWQRLALFAVPGGEQRAFTINGHLKDLAGIPTLVLWGNEDRVICSGDAKRCQELPRAWVRIARGVGHSLPLEVPAWANEQIGTFLRFLEAERQRAA